MNETLNLIYGITRAIVYLLIFFGIVWLGVTEPFSLLSAIGIYTAVDWLVKAAKFAEERWDR
jgi:hypothetical protein